MYCLLFTVYVHTVYGIADRLLAQGFSAELQLITGLMTHPKRQTLLFSATMTASLAEVESVASDDTLRFDIYNMYTYI